MIKIEVKPSRLIKTNESYEEKPLEFQLAKIMEEKTPIQSMSPEIFTERKQGVLPEYNIRTDRWKIAEQAMEKVSQIKIGRRGKTDGETSASSSEPAA